MWGSNYNTPKAIFYLQKGDYTVFGLHGGCCHQSSMPWIVFSKPLHLGTLNIGVLWGLYIEITEKKLENTIMGRSAGLLEIITESCSLESGFRAVAAVPCIRRRGIMRLDTGSM